MSKIEKALKKARAERGPRSPQTDQTATEMAKTGAGQLVAVSPASSYEVDARNTSAQSIALMQEPVLRAKQELAELGIIHTGMEENGTVRTFREIRTRILQRSQGRNGVLMVTSVSSESGGTFVALNLGAVFAFDAGKTALVMDCNLRHPWASDLFSDDPATPGLTDYLEEHDLDLSQIIRPTGVERLRVIAAGGRRGTATEYFTSLRMRQLLDGLRHRYPDRFIIIDAPPMSESADTHILAELCDYIVLVVPYARVTSTEVENCIRAIDSKKFLGVVFNNDPELPRLRWSDSMRSVLTMVLAQGKNVLKAMRNAAKRK